MFAGKWIKGCLVVLTAFFLCAWAFQMEAYARAGSGRSMGSRGSRSAAPPKPYTAPRPTQPSPTRPGVTPTPTPRPMTPPVSQPSSFWRSFGGGMLGGMAGGLLFHSMFGGPSVHGGGGGYGGGGGGYGGPGLFDIILLAGIAYLIYWYIKKKRREAAAGAYYSTGQTMELPQPTYQPAYYDQPPPQTDADLDQGLANIRQYDPYFEEAQFQDQCMDVFFKIQGAWANRDLAAVRHLLTNDMYRLLQGDADALKAEKKINKLDNIAVRSVDITEAWQEAGQDFITVRVYANLLDYTVDEASGQVLSGSKTEPVKFDEYWTFTRPVGNNPWQLSAINQAGQALQ